YYSPRKPKANAGTSSKPPAKKSKGDNEPASSKPQKKVSTSASGNPSLSRSKAAGARGRGRAGASRAAGAAAGASASVAASAPAPSLTPSPPPSRPRGIASEMPDLANPRTLVTKSELQSQSVPRHPSLNLPAGLLNKHVIAAVIRTSANLDSMSSLTQEELDLMMYADAVWPVNSIAFRGPAMVQLFEHVAQEVARRKGGDN
ncbi:hypothetical protein AURDEDRAFT_177551, partial [Auricularia subglabra TFB-10046 SS5]